MILRFLNLRCNRGVRASLSSGTSVQPQLQSRTFSIFVSREMESSSSFPRQQRVQHQLQARNSGNGIRNAPASPANNNHDGFKIPKRSFGGGAGMGAGLQNCPFQFGSIEPDDLLPPHSTTNENNGLPETPPTAVAPIEAYPPAPPAAVDGVNREFMADGKKAIPFDARVSDVTEPKVSAPKAAVVPTSEEGEGFTEPGVNGGTSVLPHADESPVIEGTPPQSPGADTGTLSSSEGEAGGESAGNLAAVTEGSPSPLEGQESPVGNAGSNSSESDGPDVRNSVVSPWNSSSSGLNGKEPVRASSSTMANNSPPPTAESSVFSADDFPALGSGPSAVTGRRGRGGAAGAASSGGWGGAAVNKAASFGGKGAARSSVVVQAQQQADDPGKPQQRPQPSSPWKQSPTEVTTGAVAAGKTPSESGRGIHGAAATGAASGPGGRGGSPNRNQESGNSSDTRRGGGGGAGAGNRRQAGGGERRTGAGQRYGSPNARGEKVDPIDALARLLTKILRHQALELGLKVRSDGFVSVKELLNLRMKTRGNMSLSAYTVEDVLQAVKLDKKQRLGIKEDNEELFIRANQGHSIESIETEELLKPITTANEIPDIVHGTYKKYLDAIFKEGLNRMTRRHVHFATGVYGSSDVISGMRSSCEVLVYLNVEKALADGMKLYISENGVVLTEGFDGVVPPDYFAKVLRLPDMKPIIPRKQST